MSLKLVAERCGIAPGVVFVIQSGKLIPCRSMSGYDYKVGSLGAISRVAVDYCGAQLDACESAIKECCTVFLERWPNISIPEIREAFSLAVSGGLDSEEIKLTAFYGMFTVDTFAKVISAYEKKRNHAISELAKLAEEEEKQKNEERKRAEWQEYKQRVCEDFKALRISNERFGHPDKVPLLWAKILIDAGLINGRNSALWIKAKDTVVSDFMSDYREKRPHPIISEGSRRAVYERLVKEPDFFPEELIQTAKNTYGRLLVFLEISPFKQPHNENK